MIFKIFFFNLLCHMKELLHPLKFLFFFFMMHLLRNSIDNISNSYIFKRDYKLQKWRQIAKRKRKWWNKSRRFVIDQVLCTFFKSLQCIHFFALKVLRILKTIDEISIFKGCHANKIMSPKFFNAKTLKQNYVLKIVCSKFLTC